MNLQTIIADIDQSLFSFQPQTVIHFGKTKNIQIPVLVDLGRGRKPTSVEIAEKQFEIYISLLVEQTKLEIEREIEQEKKANEIFRATLEKEFAEKEKQMLAKLEVTNTQKTRNIKAYYKGVSRFGIVLLVLTSLFAFAMNWINFQHFFGVPFAELFGGGALWVSGLISLMLAFSFGFFAMLKNAKMVKKTFWLLPADLAIAFIVTNLKLDATIFVWVSSIVFIAYLLQFGFIIYELSRLFVGEGIKGDESSHYERIFGTLFE